MTTTAQQLSPTLGGDFATHHPSTLADALILQAISRTATAIDLEPAEADEVRASVKRRKRSLIDIRLPAPLGQAVMARLCLLAGLDPTAEQAQTGRVLVRLQSRLVDVFVLRRQGPCPSLALKILDDNADEPSQSQHQLPHRLPNVLEPGTMVGAYRVLEIAGRGGMGIVYRGEHEALARPVAIKVLDRKVLSEDQGAEVRFYLEARAAARIQHEGIIDVFDVGTLADGRPYLIMELLSGRSLTEIIDQTGPVPFVHAAFLGRQIAAALAAAHDRGVIHCDVTPNNIFVLPGQAGERVKIVDFGAAHLSESPTVVDPDGMVIGTPWYMAPEQARGEDCDARTDIYGLGVVLFELVTGSVPFSGPTSKDVLLKHIVDKPPGLLSPYGPVPEDLSRIIATMLRKQPERRFQSAHEVATALANADLSSPSAR